MTEDLSTNGERTQLIKELASLRAEVHTHVLKQLDVLTDAVNDGEDKLDGHMLDIAKRLSTLETKVEERTSLKRSNTAIWVASIAALGSIIAAFFSAGAGM
jgi:predicted nuclease with TOPRIM domain